MDISLWILLYIISVVIVYILIKLCFTRLVPNTSWTLGDRATCIFLSLFSPFSIIYFIVIFYCYLEEKMKEKGKENFWDKPAKW